MLLFLAILSLKILENKSFLKNFNLKSHGDLCLPYEKGGIPAPLSLCFDSINKKLLIGDEYTNRILILNTQNDSLIGKIECENTTRDFTIDYDKNKIYAVHEKGFISVIDFSYNLLKLIRAGNLPQKSVLSQNKLFCINVGSNDVTLINTLTDEIDTIIQTGIEPVDILAEKIKNRIFIANYIDNSVTIINPDLSTKTLFVGNNPIALASSSGKVYVTNEGSNTISVIDTSLNITKTINIGTKITNLASDTDRIYCTEDLNSKIAIINCISDTIETQIPVCPHPKSLCITRDKVYCGSNTAYTISIIDKIQQIFLKNISVSSPARELIWCNGKIYATQHYNGKIAVIDENTDSVIKYIRTGCYPFDLIFSPLLEKIFITDITGAIIKIDAINFLTEKIIETEGAPCKLIMAENKLYCTDCKNDELIVIEPNSFCILKRIKVGEYPTEMIFSDFLNKLWVLNGDSTISVIDPISDALIKNINVGFQPVFFLLKNDKIYCLTGEDSCVIIDAIKDSVIKSISVGLSPIYLIDCGSKIYCLNADKSVNVIDCIKDSVIKSFSLINVPSKGICVSNKIYVSISGNFDYPDSQVAVFDLSSDSLIKYIKTGIYPDALIFDTIGYIYCLNLFDTLSAVINITSDSVIKNIKTGLMPIDAVITQENTVIANFLSSDLSIKQRIIKLDEIPSYRVKIINPYFNLNSLRKLKYFEIYNILGQRINRNFYDLPSGVYFIKLKDRKVFKLIKIR